MIFGIIKKIMEFTDEVLKDIVIGWVQHNNPVGIPVKEYCETFRAHFGFSKEDRNVASSLNVRIPIFTDYEQGKRGDGVSYWVKKI